MKFELKRLYREEFSLQIKVLFLLFTISFLLVTFLNPVFIKLTNIRNLLDHNSVYLILSLGMSFVIVSGGIDLSIGSVMGLTGIIFGKIFIITNSVLIAIIISLILGCVLGLFNGYVIIKHRITPIIATLATMSLYRGLALIISEGKPIYGFPKYFTALSKINYKIFTIPITFATLLIIFVLIIFRYTKFGHYILCIGSSSKAVRRVGINSDYYKISVYVINSLFATIASLILISRLNSAEPISGMMIESQIIAITVLGGTLIYGGRVSVLGIGLASLFMTMISNALTIVGISSYYQGFISGLIILISILFSERKSRDSIPYDF